MTCSTARFCAISAGWERCGEIGSVVGTRADLSEVFALHAARRTRVIYEERHLSEVNEAIDEVLQGRATARLVLRP
jgi:propanol-preferring alcohol dehydrogenase